MRSLPLVIALLVSACSAQQAQSTVARVAQVSLVDTTDLRLHFYEELNDRCLEESVSFDGWRVCMTPAYRMDRAVGVLDAALRAAQVAFDAGESFDLARVFDAARALARVLLEVGVALPNDLRALLGLEDGQ